MRKPPALHAFKWSDREAPFTPRHSLLHFDLSLVRQMGGEPREWGTHPLLGMRIGAALVPQRYPRLEAGGDLGARVEYWVRMGEGLGRVSEIPSRMCRVVYKQKRGTAKTKGNGSNGYDVTFLLFFTPLCAACFRIIFPSRRPLSVLTLKVPEN